MCHMFLNGNDRPGFTCGVGDSVPIERGQGMHTQYAYG